MDDIPYWSTKASMNTGYRLVGATGSDYGSHRMEIEAGYQDNNNSNISSNSLMPSLRMSLWGAAKPITEKAVSEETPRQPFQIYSSFKQVSLLSC